MNLTVKILKFEEGYRAYPYVDTEGYPTVGIGTKIGTKGAPIDQYTFTVGEKAAEALLGQELEKVAEWVEKKYTSLYVHPNESRISIFESMAYQIGCSGLDKFKNMWQAVHDNDWEKAAIEALDSKWAKQTPERAKRHAEVLRTGTTDAYKDLI